MTYGLRDSLATFAHAMEGRLRANDHKEHWSFYSVGHLRKRIADELGELKRAIDAKESPERILREAADVANFCMMVADNYRSEFDPAHAQMRTRR